MAKNEEQDNNAGQIKERILETEMRESYLSYAMSVIIARALPDVRDGLKPVHRRVLYTMSELGLRHNAKFQKSSAVVGQTLAWYHPHGDLAVYETLVRMAQYFAMRYPLVRGQGNFGSVDGDSAAAQRYTEAKMEVLAEELLADIDKDTVDFMDNYSATRKEPKVLPAKVPQLLLNGTMGIAVGMATSIPPHNLTELINAVVALIDNPEATVDDLMEHVQGPDFPTGATIYNPDEIKRAYTTGKGSIAMRAVAEIEENGKGYRILITEIPYQVNKATLVEKIAELVKTKKIIGISDLRDESSGKEVRLVIELKSDSYPKKILNQLYKMTPMQSFFHVNLLALVDKGTQPEVLNLKSVLQHFIKHRQEVVTRRTQFELNKAEARAHILEGLKIALDNLDAVIKTIRKSETKEEAHANLLKKFKLTDVQATAIMEMRLQALAGLERKKVENEYEEKKVLIKELKGILADPQKILSIIREESLELREKYGDERKTKIIRQTIGKFSEKDLVPNEEVIVTMTKGGYIKRQPVNMYRSQHRGGKGIIGMTTKEEDMIEIIQATQNHDDVFFFTNRGRVFKQKVYEIPQSSRIAKGTAMANIIQLSPEEFVTTIRTMASYKAGDNFIMFTRRGIIKKTAAEKYANIRSNGLIAIKLDEGDELGWVRTSQKGDTVVILTKEAQSIHFSESDARSLGRSTRGVRGIKLRANDEVIAADIADNIESYASLVISGKGLGKRTSLSQYSLQKRGGLGVKAMNLTERTGKIIGARLVSKKSTADLIITSRQGQVIRLPLKTVPLLGRVTQGVTLMRLKGSDKVAAFSVIEQEGQEEGLETTDKNAPKPDSGSKKPVSKPKPFVKKIITKTKPASVVAKTKLAKSKPKESTTFTKRKIKSKGLVSRVSKLAQSVKKGFVKKKIKTTSAKKASGSRLSKRKK